MKPRVYTASTLRHGPMWKELRRQWSEMDFTSRWLDTYQDWAGVSIEVICRAAWDAIEQDVGSSRFILCYADTYDLLRGGLVEVGMGLICQKTVIVVGNHVSYGTWQYHKLVRRAPDFYTARKIINEMWNAK